LDSYLFNAPIHGTLFGKLVKWYCCTILAQVLLLLLKTKRKYMEQNGDMPIISHDIGVMLLIELPGTRLTQSDANAGRSHLSKFSLDIMTAVEREESWIYVPLPEANAKELLADPKKLLCEFLDTQPGKEPPFTIRTLHSLKTLGNQMLGAQQPWLYVSQTDIPETMESEFNRWFNEEHLPLLAAVKGTIRARRYIADKSPHYLACYDLETQETRGGAEWKAALATPWRDRVHSRFVNPRKTMFMRLR
jgi:hypothetical protein